MTEPVRALRTELAMSPDAPKAATQGQTGAHACRLASPQEGRS